MAENRYSEGRGSCLSSTKPGSYSWILGEWSQLQQCDFIALLWKKVMYRRLWEKGTGLVWTASYSMANTILISFSNIPLKCTNTMSASALVRLTIAVTKHHDQKQVEKKRIYLAYLFQSQFIITRSQDRNSNMAGI